MMKCGGMKKWLVVGLSVLSGLVAWAEVLLPVGYTQLDWIQSSGTQWINTGYSPNANTKIEASFNTCTRRAWGVYFGCSTADEPRDGVQVRWYGGNDRLNGWFGNPNFQTEGVINMTQNQDVTVTLERGSFTLNGTTSTLTSQNVPDANPLYLFAGYCLHPQGSAAETFDAANHVYRPQAMRLYSFKVSEEGVMKRDFVPCCSATGEVGLWDRVEGRFYGNQGTGTFNASYGVASRLSWIRSSGTQWIDTGYKPNMSTKIDAAFNVCTPTTSWGTFFGCTSADVPNDGVLARFDNRAARLNGWFGNSNWQAEGNFNIAFDTDVAITLQQGSFTVNGDTMTFATVQEPDPNPFYLFAAYNKKTSNHVYRPQAMKLYSFRISETNVVMRDFVPYRTVDGTLGLWDDVEGKFYPNQGTGVFTWGGLAYDRQGTTLFVHEGTLTADDLTGSTEVRKISPNKLQVAGVRTYPGSLTLEKGWFLLQDDEPTTSTVNGTLTLKGGAFISIDLTSAGCDMFTATAVAFENASAENPIGVRINYVDSQLAASNTFIASGVPGENGEVDFIRVLDDAPFKFVIQDGALLLCADETVPTHAVWAGTATSALDDPASWTHQNIIGGPVATNTVPLASETIVLPNACTFNCPAGQTITGTKVVLPATLGADCDWSGLDLPLSGKVDLKGHTLTLARFNGTYEITDSTGLDYQVLASIQSSGTQWIDTGYLVNAGTKIEASFNTCSRTTGWGIFFGCSSTDDAINGVQVRWYGTNNKLNSWFGSGDYTKEGSIDVNQNTDVTVTLERGLFTLNEKSATLSNQATPSANPLYLFAGYCTTPYGGVKNLYDQANHVYRPQAMRLYSFKISEGGMVKRDFLPVRRLSDGELGLLDVAEGRVEFYPNHGTGSFTAGNPTGRIVNSGTQYGTLRLVAANDIENATVTLSGSLKLVKEGKGAFTAKKTDQTYSCGTVVDGGVIHLYNDNTRYTTSKCLLGALGSTITLNAAGKLNVSGTYGLGAYAYVLNGGTLANESFNGVAYMINETDAAAFDRVTLMADSTLWPLRQFIFDKGTLDLGGKTLTVDFRSFGSKNLFLKGGTQQIVNGTIRVQGGLAGEYDRVRVSNEAVDARTVTFEIVQAEFDLQKDLNVSNYIARASLGTGTADNTGTAALNVWGTFQPWTDFFYGCTLQDGATLDLSEQAGTWSVTSVGACEQKTVQFATNATITVSFGARPIKGGDCVIAWTEETCPPGDVIFKSATPNPDYRLRRDTLGLYIERGLVIFVR